jgi:hypothetical protein
VSQVLLKEWQLQTVPRSKTNPVSTPITLHWGGDSAPKVLCFTVLSKYS